MKVVLFAMLFALAAGCNQGNPPASADRSTADEYPAAAAEPVDPANTGINVRDRDTTTKTPLDQQENKTDIDITADIRRQVVDNLEAVAPAAGD